MNATAVSNRTTFFRHAAGAGGSVVKVAVEYDDSWRQRAECSKRKYRVKRHDGKPVYDWDDGADKDAEQNARTVCMTECPVRQQCLDHSLAVKEPSGMWGGVNEMERFFLLGQRKTFNRRNSRRAQNDSGS